MSANCVDKPQDLHQGPLLPLTPLLRLLRHWSQSRRLKFGHNRKHFQLIYYASKISDYIILSKIK